MIDLEFEFTSKVYLYQGDKASWHMVNLPDETSKDISAFTKHNQPKRGFGSVRVTVQIGESLWKTSVFPLKDGPYVLPIKAAIRKAENIAKGDEVTVQIEVAI